MTTGIDLDEKSKVHLKNVGVTGFNTSVKVRGGSELHAKDSMFSGAYEASSDCDKDDAGDDWYKKPVGIIGITVFSGLVIACLIWVINHNFHLGL